MQVELHCATRLVEELILAVDTISSAAPGQLSAWPRSTAQGDFVEIVDGVRVLRQFHRDCWGLLRLERIQHQLRRILAPFQDPELHTMTVRSVPESGALGAIWVITANRALRAFAHGARLEMPALTP